MCFYELPYYQFFECQNRTLRRRKSRACTFPHPTKSEEIQSKVNHQRVLKLKSDLTEHMQ